MNQNERERMKLMVGVQARELTLVQAAKAPTAGHPWRRFGAAAGRKFRNGDPATSGRARVGVRDAGWPERSDGHPWIPPCPGCGGAFWRRARA